PELRGQIEQDERQDFENQGAYCRSRLTEPVVTSAICPLTSDLPRTGSASPSPFSFSSCSKKNPPALQFSPPHLKRCRSTTRYRSPVDCSAVAGEARSDRPQRSASVHSDPPHSASTRRPQAVPEPAPPRLPLLLLEHPNAAPPGSALPSHRLFPLLSYCHRPQVPPRLPPSGPHRSDLSAPGPPWSVRPHARPWPHRDASQNSPACSTQRPLAGGLLLPFCSVRAPPALAAAPAGANPRAASWRPPPGPSPDIA